MDSLKKFFPIAFAQKKDLGALILSVVIQVAVAVVIGWVFALLSIFPLIGLLFDLIGSLIGLYILANIVLTFLDYFKVIK